MRLSERERNELEQTARKIRRSEDGTDVFLDILAIAAGSYTDSTTFALALSRMVPYR